jgi:hypothetical protein
VSALKIAASSGNAGEERWKILLPLLGTASMAFLYLMIVAGLHWLSRRSTGT